MRADIHHGVAVGIETWLEDGALVRAAFARHIEPAFEDEILARAAIHLVHPHRDATAGFVRPYEDGAKMLAARRDIENEIAPVGFPPALEVGEVKGASGC